MNKKLKIMISIILTMNIMTLFLVGAIASKIGVPLMIASVLLMLGIVMATMCSMFIWGNKDE